MLQGHRARETFMPFVIFAVNVQRLVPKYVSAEARAVLAAPYVHVDDAAWQPGITRAEIADDDIRPLSTYAIGTKVYIEGTRDENLDDDDTTGNARIWWRGTVVGILAPGGSA
jgi:hypothetical protein